MGWMRDIGLPLLAAGATVALPFMWLVSAFIVAGQAHFFMAYLYQYRGGRMNRRYLAAACVIAVAATLYFAFNGGLLALAILISALFSFHFAYDEFTLHDERMTASRFVTVVGFTLTFFFLVMLFIFPAANWLVVASAAAGLSTLIARFWLTRSPPTRAERYLWFVAALLFAVAVISGLPGSILATIVLLHCANWYVGYGTRLSGEPVRARKYWIEAVGLFVLSALLFAAFSLAHFSFLGVLFSLAPYYAWAVAHILLSLVTLLPRRA